MDCKQKLDSIGLEFKHLSQLAYFVVVIYSSNSSVKTSRFIDFTLISAFLLLLDDHIKKSKDNCTQWMAIVSGNLTKYTTKLEIFYSEIINPFRKTLTPFQLKRFDQMLRDYINHAMREHETAVDLSQLTLDEYIKHRIEGDVSHFQWLMIEVGLNLDIQQELFESEEMVKLIDNFYKCIAIFQDIYSYQKQNTLNQTKVNYLSLTMRDIGFDLDMAVKKALGHILGYEQAIYEHLSKVCAEEKSLGDLFFETFGNYLHTVVLFYKKFGRYNEFNQI